MSTPNELRLRYFIQLASNIGVTAKREATEFERAQDQMTRSTRNTDRAARDLERTLGQLANNTSVDRQVRFFDRLADSVGRARAQVRQLQQAIASGVAALPALSSAATAGAAGVYTADRLMRSPREFDFQLRQAALTAYGAQGVDAARVGMRSLQGSVDSSVRRFGGTREQALSGYKLLIGTGAFNADEAEKLLPDVQEAAVGTATQVEKLSSLAMRMKTVMSIPVDKMRVAMSRMSRVGQLGSVELDQQAGFIADLSGQYGAIGYKGERGAVAAAVDLQLAFKAAGSAESARTILENFYGKTLSPDTAKDFARIKGRDGKPIDLYGEIAKRRAVGMDGVEAFMDLSDQVLASTGGDKRVRAVLAGVDLRNSGQAEAAVEGVKDVFERAGMGTFLQDKEAMRGFLALSKQRQDRAAMIDTAMADRGQTLDTITALVQQSPEVQRQKALAEAAIATQRAFEAVAEPVNGMVSGAAALAQEFPRLAAAIAGVAAAGTVATAVGVTAGLVSGAAGGFRLRSAAGATATAAAAAVKAAPRAYNPFAGLGVTMPAAAAAAPTLMQRMAGAGRWLGPAVAALGVGLESYDAITDERLTAMGKARGVSEAFGGAGGAWAGAKAGAALGSLAGPLGTVAGTLVGGTAGYMLGKWGVSSMWGDNPQRDYVRLTDPKGAALASVPGGGQATVQLGEGVLRLDVRVSSDGSVSTSTETLRPMQLLRVEAGSTDPGSFAALSGGR